jgi:signal transduction histidine kinase
VTGTRRRRVAAGVAGGLVCAIAVVAAALALVNVGTPSPDFTVHRQFFVTDVLIALVYAPFGTFVVVRSGHVIGWALLLVGAGFALTSFGIQYAVLGVDHPGIPAYAWIVQLVVSGWVVGVLTCLLVVPLLVGHAAPTGARRVLAWVALGIALAAGALRYLVQIEDGPPNPLAGDVDSWAVPLCFLLGLVAVGDLLLRTRRDSPAERRPVVWVALSLTVVTVSYLAFELGLSLGQPVLGVSAAALTAAMFMVPVAIFVLVRQPSWNLDLAVSRATVGALLTMVVVAAYVVLVWLADRLLPDDRESAGLLAVALLALAVMPIRTRLQRLVDRLVYGSVSDAGDLLDRLGSDFGAVGDGQTVLEGLAEGLRHSLRLSSVTVETLDADLVVTVGRGQEQRVAVPLHSRGRQVGTLWLSPPAGQRLDVRTRQLGQQIAGLVASALDLALVNADLERARGRLVEVRHEERRVLRRELHDGLGPSLAGISLGLAAIERGSTLTADHADLLAQLREELGRRAEDVRQMSRVLVPPALEDGRLGAALDGLAQRFRTADFDVEVQADQPDTIDTVRQVAIYHVAAEALLNAHRHAGARHCRIVLQRGDGEQLRLSVADDGRGLPAATTPGVGLQSMHERAVELGGSFEIEATDPGTTVRVVLP